MFEGAQQYNELSKNIKEVQYFHLFKNKKQIPYNEKSLAVLMSYIYSYM